MRQMFGKYRGVVRDNADPLRQGRLQVSVSVAYGQHQSGWALPCVPYAGRGVGFFAIPPVGANVWVEFEGGSLDHPVWSGCFWEEGEAPGSPVDPAIKVLKTTNGTIKISDQSGSAGISIETAAGMKIVLDSSGIELNNGNGAVIKLTNNQVNVNNGALEIQ